jgi:predicted nucleic acid-binding protein
MTAKIIADTAAIVGFLSETDQWRERALRLFEQSPKPFLTCEAVIAESCFLMRDSDNGQKQVLDLISDDVLEIDFSVAAEVEKINWLMQKYRSVPMSLADACLVRMAEIFNVPIFTFDSDFEIYSKHGRERIQVIGLDN